MTIIFSLWMFRLESTANQIYTTQYMYVNQLTTANITFSSLIHNKVQCSVVMMRPSFFKIFTKGPPIARPNGRSMGCLLCVQILPEFLHLCVQYDVTLDRVITALDCILFNKDIDNSVKKVLHRSLHCKASLPVVQWSPCICGLGSLHQWGRSLVQSAVGGRALPSSPSQCVSWWHPLNSTPYLLWVERYCDGWRGDHQNWVCVPGIMSWRNC